MTDRQFLLDRVNKAITQMHGEEPAPSSTSGPSVLTGKRFYTSKIFSHTGSNAFRNAVCAIVYNNIKYNIKLYFMESK